MQTPITMLTSAFTALLCGSVAAQAPTHVWKVGGGGTAFADVQAAVDAASDGDLILIRSGTYPAFQAIDKAVSLLPALGASVTLSGECRIEALSAGKLQLLGNLNCQTYSNSFTPALLLRFNEGAVLLRNATFTGTMHKVSVLKLMESKIVVVDACTVYGANNSLWYGHGGSGLFARRSNVASSRSVFVGGNGGSIPNCDSWYWGYDGGDGGDAYECPEGFLFDAGSTFRGGNGGEPGPDDYDPLTGIYTPAGTGGDGGSGIILGSIPPTALNPRVERLSTTTAGGLAGGFGGCGYLGSAGSAVLVHNGSQSTLTGTKREITLQSLAHESTLIPFTASGASGERVYVMLSQSPDFQFDAALFGCRIQKQPMLTTSLAVGTIPASGLLQTQLAVRRLRPGDEAGTFIVQALFVSPAGSVQISNATAIALVDTSVPLN